MAIELSKEELERIRAFANTPKHARTPDMLVPVVTGEDGGEGRAGDD